MSSRNPIANGQQANRQLSASQPRHDGPSCFISHGAPKYPKYCSRHRCTVPSCPNVRAVVLGPGSGFFCSEHDSRGKGLAVGSAPLQTKPELQPDTSMSTTGKDFSFDSQTFTGAVQVNSRFICYICDPVAARTNHICFRHTCQKDSCPKPRFKGLIGQGAYESLCADHLATKIKAQVREEENEEDEDEGSQRTEDEGRGRERKRGSKVGEKLVGWAKNKRKSLLHTASTTTEVPSPKSGGQSSIDLSDQPPDWPKTAGFQALSEKTDDADQARSQSPPEESSTPPHPPHPPIRRRRLIGFWGRCHGPDPSCRSPAVSDIVWVCQKHRSSYVEDDPPGVVDCPATTSEFSL